MDEKESYCMKIEERLRDLGGQVEEMMGKAKKFARKTRKRFEKDAEKFRESKKVVTEKVTEIRNAGGRSWKDLTQGLEKGMSELQKGFESAVQEFKQGEAGGEKKRSKKKG
jgi:dsDNA-specific endonuclease/ATPase MutS2